ncbi:MAG: pyrroline-5-carboxylate reductase [Nitrospiraceae bacterium]|nr:pyrroline-5-carboxylate reductase [Nitrospiraceae bacterium]
MPLPASKPGKDLKKMTGFIGGGNMAEALIKGIRAGGGAPRAGSTDIIVSEPTEQRRRYLEQTYGVHTTESNREAASRADVVVIAVKPQVIDQVLRDIADGMPGESEKSGEGGKLIVSIAAGIRLSYLTERLGTKNVVRAMPNTPALAGEGMTVLALCECIPDAGFSRVKDIFMSVGKVIVMPEKYMDAVTALSGSGPAFYALFIEAVAEGAAKAGLPEDVSLELALQTALGTVRMLEEGIGTLKLRQMVTSPGGTTEAGLKVLEERGFKGVLYDTIEAAVRRAGELGKS